MQFIINKIWDCVVLKIIRSERKSRPTEYYCYLAIIFKSVQTHVFVGANRPYVLNVTSITKLSAPIITDMGRDFCMTFIMLDFAGALASVHLLKAY
jgi:hypothetical protein